VREVGALRPIVRPRWARFWPSAVVVRRLEEGVSQLSSDPPRALPLGASAAGSWLMRSQARDAVTVTPRTPMTSLRQPSRGPHTGGAVKPPGAARIVSGMNRALRSVGHPVRVLAPTKVGPRAVNADPMAPRGRTPGTLDTLARARCAFPRQERSSPTTEEPTMITSTGAVMPPQALDEDGA
jgi:hypothetical protein